MTVFPLGAALSARGELTTWKAVERTKMAIRIKARGNESAEQMLRRFKKLCEKEGLTKDIKKRAFFEKPSERKQRALRKAQKRRAQASVSRRGR
ncbi:MAG: 30S ribosomal protein S21 [Phycisphaeraceae bacterium]